MYLALWPPQLFAAAVIIAVATSDGGFRWLRSGAPILTYCLMLGSSCGSRVLPFIGLWTLIASINLFYVMAATSWLFYWVFAIACFPTTGLVCLCQFSLVARIARKYLRALLQGSHFLNDKIAFFGIPALEIDTEVNGLMVVRGVTLHLSSLRLVAHGVEVGIKLSEDMELSLQTEEVEITLFREIKIGDVFANLKGGQFEMSFGKLARRKESDHQKTLLETDTPLLQAAATSQPTLPKSDDLTKDEAPQPVSHPAHTVDLVTALPLDDENAAKQYDEIIRSIRRTNSIDQLRLEMDWLSNGIEDTKRNKSNEKDLRAAVCSQLHEKPSVQHAPKHSVKVTSLQNMGPLMIKRLLHRMPLLYRLLLNPVAYFHPVSIDSITAAGSGKWIHAVLNEKVFKHSTNEESEASRLEKRLSTWLSGANFVLELTNITGIAQVPIMKGFDITCILGFQDIMAYRTLPQETNLNQVVRLGGADATITIPVFLLPHHEHWLPEKPSLEKQDEQKQAIIDTDGVPQTLQAKNELQRMKRDETNVKVAAHIRLPACFDQELLDFVAALVKATKIAEIERDVLSDTESDADADTDSSIPKDSPSSEYTAKHKSPVKTFSKNLSRDLKDFNTNFSANMKTAHSSLGGMMKKTTINAMANDRWIAKMVGKITKNLERARGDVGYSGELPVLLGPYRQRSESGSKLLP